MFKTQRHFLRRILSPSFLKSKTEFLNFRVFCRFTETNPLTKFQSEPAIVKNTKTSEEEIEKVKGNIPERILKKVGENLHENASSPVGIVREKIDTFFQSNFLFEDKSTVVKSKTHIFKTLRAPEPKVSAEKNFDNLLIPANHPSRSPSETFYFDNDTVLRTHMTCHTAEYIASGYDAFVVSGDCYRKDTIDSKHYPVFHQTDGCRLFDAKKVSLDYVIDDLKNTIIDLIKFLFGDIPYRWNKDSFPFTSPSFELEIEKDNQWSEIIGCGILEPEILKKVNRSDKVGWAFGIGLDRLALALFGIPDIRLLHSTDDRFTSQFTAGEITPFRPFSKYPACCKDISFWIDSGFNEKEFFAIVREVAGHLVESVRLLESYTDAATGRVSRCYRLAYRSFSRSLTNDEVDTVQAEVTARLSRDGSLELRE